MYRDTTRCELALEYFRRLWLRETNGINGTWRIEISAFTASNNKIFYYCSLPGDASWNFISGISLIPLPSLYRWHLSLPLRRSPVKKELLFLTVRQCNVRKWILNLCDFKYLLWKNEISKHTFNYSKNFEEVYLTLFFMHFELYDLLVKSVFVRFDYIK